jgi:glycosyltransferase involved in cell wall biosynthesis
VNLIYDTGVDLAHAGGAVTHILEKASAIGRQGVRVEIWAHRTPETDRAMDIPMKQLGRPRARTILRHLSYLGYEARAAWTILMQPSGTILLARQRIFGVAVLVCARIRGMPIAYEVNDNVLDQLRLAAKLSPFKGWLVDILLQAAARQATVALALTPQLKQLCIEHYRMTADTVHVIPVGCDLTRFSPMDSGQAQRQLGLDSGYRYLVNVSSFTAWSGIDFIISLMPLLLAADPKLRLILVGGGATLESCRALARRLSVDDAVVFVGPVPYASVPNYINASEVCFCVKSEELTTTSPTRLYEYLGCGKCVFVTRGYRNTVPCDALVEVSTNDPRATVRIVLDLLRDESLRHRLGQAARDYALQHASWQGVAARVTSIMARMTS